MSKESLEADFDLSFRSLDISKGSCLGKRHLQASMEEKTEDIFGLLLRNRIMLLLVHVVLKGLI